MSAALQDFRREVHDFIAAELPDDIRAHMRLGHPPTQEHIRRWMRILNTRAWSCPSWKREWGGPGWSAEQRLVFLEEIFAAPAPEPLSFNATMVGPVIGTFGSEAQKRRFLPAIANLDIWFCQGFSEPDAGSDLAALRTAAVRDGDSYVVTGQKTWTSTAHEADWVFALVRTDPKAAKPQLGISFLLIDLASPGIAIRPLPSIDNRHHLNEVFFDEVRVPAANLVGEENRGWDYAKFLLSNERTGIARVGKSQERLRHAAQLADRLGAASNPLLRQRMLLAETELRALAITQARMIAAASRNAGHAGDASILKLKGSDMQQRVAELLMDIGGPYATVADAGPDWSQALWPAYAFSRAATIYGGSSEVQKTLLARAMGL